MLATPWLFVLGCGDVTVDQGVDLEPGIDLPGTTDGTADGAATEGDPAATSGTGAGLDETGGSVDSTGTAGGPGDEGGPPVCDEQTLELTVERPQVVLLLDESHSMVDNQWDHDGDPVTAPVTRWSSLYQVVDVLTHDVQHGIDLGMVLFPSPSLTDNDWATACLVDPTPAAPVAPDNADAIVAALSGPDALDLFGGTPASAGMQVALEHLAVVEDGRPQAVVLVTDGAANCMAGTTGSDVFTEYDEDLAPLVAGAFEAGVPTYVIGVDIIDAVGTYPQDNPYARLSELAVAGGVPREGPEAFYNTTDEGELLAALDGIAADIGCTFPLDPPAELADQVTVRVGDAEVPRVDECPPGGEGWRYLQDAAPYESIELCAATCEAAHVVASLQLEYVCPPEG